MGVSEVLGNSFNVLKNNPKIILPYLLFTALLGGSIVVYVFSILGGLSTGLQSVGSAPAGIVTVFRALAPILIITILLAVFIAPLIVGMYINILDQGYQKKKVLLGKALDVAKAKYVSMLATSILVACAWLVVLAVLVLVFLLPFRVAGPGILTGLWLFLGAIVSLAVIVLLLVYLFEAYAVVVLENRGAIEAIKRSVQIGKQNFWAVFWVIVATIIISVAFSVFDTVIVFLIQVPLSLTSSRFVGAGAGEIVNFIISAAFSSWLAMLSAAFYKEYIAKRAKKK